MKVIAVSSFKGGTAKTSTTLHVGAALAKFHNKKVLLIDFDSQANLTTGLGIDPDEFDSMASVLQGKTAVGKVILQTQTPNLSIIPGDIWLERVELTEPLAHDRYAHEKLKEIVSHLNYDVIIIDTPPSICWLTESAIIAADHAIICATPEFYSVKGLQRLAQFMSQVKDRHFFTILGVSLSFWNKRGKSNSAFLDVIEETFPGKVLSAKIRRDIGISEASIHGKPIFEVMPSSRASDDYQNLTSELISLMT
ncbi:MAG: ParA family protein [Rhabdochlamydiaceae bacterium]|nr:ParA family protein [Candidatus Amphrikana amoebophyrae]